MHLDLRRQESILFPHVVVESFAHFVKFCPHVCVMQSRKNLSHVFDVVMPDVVEPVLAVLSVASSSARCFRIVSVKLLAPGSVVLPLISDKTLLNIEVLLSTIITGSGAGSGIAWGSVSFGAVSMFVSVFGAVWVGMRRPVEGARALVRFWTRADSAVVAAFAILPAVAISAKIE